MNTLNKSDLLIACGGYHQASRILDCSIGHVYNMPAVITGKKQISNIMLRLAAHGINTLSLNVTSDSQALEKE